MANNLTRQLRGDESTSKTVYPDKFGFATIGVGRLVDKRKPGAGLRDVEIDFMLSNDIADRIKVLSVRLPWFNDLDEARQGVLVNMAFQLGSEGLLGFTGTLQLVQQGKYAEAAQEMLRSAWAGQTPDRAKRMHDQMLTGVWQFKEGT